MTKLWVRQGLLGESGTEAGELLAGTTCRDLLTLLEHKLPKNCAVQIGVDGRLIEERDLDVPLRNEQQVIVCPVTGAGIDWVAVLVYSFVAAAVSFAINYAAQALSPRPKAPGEPAQRGDASSATYAWDGIRTNYGQGFPVPVVYGRHAVGGQVIYTDVYASTGGGLVDDRLNLILALSEGPIARVGDVVATELDGLGGVAGGTAGPPLPDHIRVNNVLLETTATATSVQVLLTSLWSPVASFGVGAVLDVRNGGTPVATVQVLAINNSSRTNLDVLLLTGNVAIGNTVEFLYGPTVPASTVTSWTTALRLNTRPGAVAYIRPGSLDQSPLPSNPFRGSSVSYSPGERLDEVDQEAIYSYELTDEVSTVVFVLSAPGGIYGQDNQGNLQSYPVRFEISWRYEGSGTWRTFWLPGNLSQSLTSFTMGDSPRIGPVLLTVGANPAGLYDPPVTGPIEVRLRRRSPSGGTGSTSAVLWRNVVFNTAGSLGYPGVALLGMTLSSGARFNGGLPEMHVRLDGVKVRLWDATSGFSSRTWEPFATGDWAFSTRPPGRNPAWILLDFLTSRWGLGRWLKDTDLDLPSFRRWAAFCDAEPSPGDPWGEAGFQCDVVMDAPRPAWEWVLAICACGRASPIYRNGKLGVVYDYSSSHSDLELTVPAKAPTQFISSANCEKVQVVWLPKANRPTAFAFQFLNGDSLYLQDVLTVEDSASTMNDPQEPYPEDWRPEVVQAYGVVRPSQLFREGVYRHRVNRLVRRELTFVTGRWALAAEVGDLIQFEHEVLRPFSPSPCSAIVLVGGMGVEEVVIDHLFASAEACEFTFRDSSGAPVTVAVDSFASDDSTTLISFTGSQDIPNGTVLVVGEKDSLTETYQIVAITLQRDLKREVRCLQWDPTVHDAVTPTMYAAGGETGIDEPEAGAAEPLPTDQDVQVIPLPDGSHRVAWARMPTRAGVVVRVYCRESQEVRWQIVAATEEDSADWPHFVPGHTYELSLCYETIDGDAPLPDAGLRVTFTASEFPAQEPPAVSNLRATAIDPGILVEWDSLDVLTARQYEIRQGSCWNSGRVIHRGRLPRALLQPAPIGAPQVLVAMQASSGLYGQPRPLTLPSWIPVGTVEVLAENDMTPSPAGTHSDTEYSDSVVRLATGKLAGSYTSAEQDASYQAPFHWSVTWALEVLDDTTVDELEDLLDSGEAAWRTVNGRQASPAFPGCDFELQVDDVVCTVDDAPEDLLVAGHRGEPGSHAAVICESRFYANAAWTSWRPHEDRVVVAQKMQVRFLFYRESAAHHPRVTAIHYRVHI